MKNEENKNLETINSLESNSMNDVQSTDLINPINEEKELDDFELLEIEENKKIEDEKKKSQEKKVKTKKLVSLIIPVAAIISGIVVGLYFGKQFYSSKYDPDQFDVKNLEDNQDDLMKKFKSINNKNGIGNVDYSKEFEPYEIVNIGFNNYSSNQYNYSVSIGEVTPQGMSAQSVRNVTIKNNDEYFCESISKGVMSIAKRFVQDNESVDVYKGSGVKVNSATYSIDKVQEYSVEQFEEKFGRTYARPTCYIISSKTVLESTSEILENNNYKINLSLDIEKSVVRYVKQMKSISDLSSYPVFKKINITYILDKELNLIESEVNEDYVVNYVINVNTHGYLKETYYPNLQLDFLNIDEDYDYEGGINQ